MRILFVAEGISPDRPGGAEISVREMATQMAKDHEVVVFTPCYGRPSGFEHANGFRIFRYPNRFMPAGALVQQKFLFFSEMTRSLARLVGMFRPDIIHAQNLLSAPAVSRVAESHGIIGVSHVRDHRFECFTSKMACRSGDATFADFARCVDRRLFALSFPYAKLVTRAIRQSLVRCGRAFAVSDYLRAEVLRKASLDVRTAYIGVDLQRIADIAPSTTVRRQVRDPDSAVLYVGGLHRPKGVIELLHGFSHVCQKLPRAMLLVAGDGPDRNIVRKLIEDNDMKRNVTLLGSISHEETISAMKASSLVVIPSLLPEAGSRAAVESLACGKPALGSNRGAIPEMLGKAGVTIAPHASVIGQTILDLLEDRERLSELGALAQERSRTFDIIRTTNQIVETYKEWLDK